MSKEHAIALTRHLIANLDEQMESAEESGFRVERYSQLSRALVAAQKRLYRLTSEGTIVMAEVPDGYTGDSTIVYGDAVSVRAEIAAKLMIYGALWRS